MKKGITKNLKNGIIWSAKQYSGAITNTLFVSYISFYATDVLKMSPFLIATVLLVTKLFDGVTDIIAGMIIDNVRLKGGKGRPYDWCIPFIALFTILTFSAPVVNHTLQAVWIGVMYVLTQAVFNTLLQAADPIYLLKAFPEEKERNNVFSVGMVFGQLVSLVMTSIFPILVAQAGTSHSAWTRIAIIGTAPFALIAMSRFFLIKEVTIDEKNEGIQINKKQSKVSVLDALKAIISNRYILILTFSIFLIVICSGMLNTSATYYFRYFVGDVKGMSVIGIASFASLIMLVLFGPLSNRFGKCNVMKFALAVSLLGNIIRWFGGTNMATIFIGMALMLFGVMPISVYFPLFLFDIMDYGEWKTGKRVEGILSVFPNFANKVASGISVSIATFILGFAGYDGAVEVQTDAAMRAIDWTFNGIPTILFGVLVIVMFLFYDIDKYMPKVKADLDNRQVQ